VVDTPDAEDITIGVDMDMNDSDDQEDDAIIPMPQEENIDTLRAKLHAKNRCIPE